MEGPDHHRQVRCICKGEYQVCVVTKIPSSIALLAFSKGQLNMVSLEIQIY
jgi:hypothetical protein